MLLLDAVLEVAAAAPLEVAAVEAAVEAAVDEARDLTVL